MGSIPTCSCSHSAHDAHVVSVPRQGCSRRLSGFQRPLPLPALPGLPARTARTQLVVVSRAGFGVEVLSGAHLQPASVSRLFIGVQPARFIVRHISRTARPNGPLSVLIVLLTLISAAIAAIRARIMHQVKACSSCHGYGIARCSLCSGTGAVGWEGKWAHKEPCPMCVGRRYVSCAECGGHYHRPMFAHIHRTAVDIEDDIAASSRPVRPRSVYAANVLTD